MRFRNAAPHALRFKLAGHAHDVPIGGEVELADKLTDAVKDRRLPLQPIAGTEDAAPEPQRDDSAPPKGTPARLWYDRAHQVRATLDDLTVRHNALLDSAGEERAKTMAKVEQLESSLAEAAAFPAKVRERLGVGCADSIIEAIDAIKGEVAKLRVDLDNATKPAAPTKPPKN